MDRTRAIELRLRRLISEDRHVTICSLIRIERRETKVERAARMERLIQLLGNPSKEQRAEQRSAWDSTSNLKAHVEKIGESELVISFVGGPRDRKRVNIPFGMIEEVWRTERGPNGLIVRAPIALPLGGAEAWLDFHDTLVAATHQTRHPNEI